MIRVLGIIKKGIEMSQERNDSMLATTKRACGMVDSYDAFDSEILMHLNSSLGVLHQIGVGPSAGFVVDDDSATWNDFVEPGPLQNLVKQYVPMSVHHDFDPPTNSSVLQSMESRLQQLESRMSYYVDPSNDNSFFEEDNSEEINDGEYDTSWEG